MPGIAGERLIFVRRVSEGLATMMIMEQSRTRRHEQSFVQSPSFSMDKLGGKDAENLIRWFVIHRIPRSLRYAARCLGASDVADIVHDVYVKILAGKAPPDDLALSTIVCKSALWTLLRVGQKSRQRDHKAKLRQREELTDVAVECSDEAVQWLTRFEMRDAIHRMMITLPYRQRLVVELRYGLGDGNEYTLDQVGKVLGICRERVRQIEATAIRKLQHPWRAKLMVQFQRDLAYRIVD